MSGNLCERTVAVGNLQGRSFTGAVGDGRLSNSNADADNWPTASAQGMGWRGGEFWNDYNEIRVATRKNACAANANRDVTFGFRAVRQVP